jgi:3-hydroxyacyl-[acyl-carrier-protein] dehydratase
MNGEVPTMPMDIRAIEKCIPHRYPFLLVDRVLELVPDDYIIAVKNVSISDPFLAGHFPGHPVMPGVLLIEGLAQAAGILGHLYVNGGLSQCLLTEISEARFRRPVVPGDVVTYDVRVKKRRAPFFWFEAKCLVGSDTVVDVKLSAYIK